MNNDVVLRSCGLVYGIHRKEKKEKREREKSIPLFPFFCLPTLFLFPLVFMSRFHSFSLVRSGAVSYRAGPDRVLYTYSYSHTLNPTILQQTIDPPNARKQDPWAITLHTKPQYPASPESETQKLRQCNRPIHSSLLPNPESYLSCVSRCIAGVGEVIAVFVFFLST